MAEARRAKRQELLKQAIRAVHERYSILPAKDGLALHSVEREVRRQLAREIDETWTQERAETRGLEIAAALVEDDLYWR